MLEAESILPLVAPHEFLILGSLDFLADGSCAFQDDGLGWGSHGTCQDDDPHCP
ncbi:MAG TPA: hypothetical protein VN033_01770 [Vulgatibacter sp.]|nr:hypothetical protein [Vulgatibacter sp.]